jgi:hypothetical protein
MGIGVGPGSRHKHAGGSRRDGGGIVTITPRRGVIELPYLDGVQHAAFPEVRT